MTLVSCFNKIFETYADKVAIEFADKKVTFDELNKNSNRIANALKDIGVNKGGRVALYLANNLELIYSFTGILKNGSVVVPMNNSFKEKEAEHLLNNSAAEAIITDKECLPIIKKILKELNELKYIIITDNNENGVKNNSIEFISYNEFIN
ncbi:MAG: AMP-binding protein, partial [Candidatus Woesearchaeota archaeon]|nr:AMP-binding protein [Candidatus Woesearchaeota archaeon]